MVPETYNTIIFIICLWWYYVRSNFSQNHAKEVSPGEPLFQREPVQKYIVDFMYFQTAIQIIICLLSGHFILKRVFSHYWNHNFTYTVSYLYKEVWKTKALFFKELVSCPTEIYFCNSDPEPLV